MLEVGNIFHNGEEFCFGFFYNDNNNELLKLIDKKRDAIETTSNLSKEKKQEMKNELEEILNNALFEKLDAIIN